MKTKNNTMTRTLLATMRLMVFILSALLITFISIDTFERRNFLHNNFYMTFQLWVCVFFIIDFFTELIFAENKQRYLKHRWLFLLLSIPYLNILTHLNIPLTHTELYWIRFIPLGRATMALAIIVGYVSKNQIRSLLASYVMTLISFVYFGSIIFFNAEVETNPNVTTYWDALWWAAMDVTTLGCNIQPLSAVGKVTSVVLAILGIMMFPLFTVYITTFTKTKNSDINATPSSK
ncbi:MAG: two pore domain potassium channel family protein [Bacteroidales bacterium]|nr:two pore domain potassium channel family protein [Bacteroidales bacterium]